MRKGDEVTVLPSGRTSTVKSIHIGMDEIDECVQGQAVTLQLADDIDISRGDMICDPENPPRADKEIEAMVVWMAEQPMELRRKYAIKHLSRDARAVVKELRYRLDISDLSQDAGVNQLGLNEIGRVSLKLTTPLFFDPYAECRATGAFIIIDEMTNNTVGAGMIVE